MRQQGTRDRQVGNDSGTGRCTVPVLALVWFTSVLWARGLEPGGDAAKVGESSDLKTVDPVEAVESVEAVWKPKIYQFSRYQNMLAKAPFGQPPAKAVPPPAPVELPKEEKQLAIAGVSVVEGKPVVYLLDLKTRAYQKIHGGEENENGIRLVEISGEANPRDVVAKVAIDGEMATVKYDTKVLDTKPKQVASNKKRKTRRASPAPVAGAQAAARKPVPTTRSIQDQRRLATVPRRRVIVPGQSTQAPAAESKPQSPSPAQQK